MEPETPIKPIRLNKFAKFFKGYMGVSSVVTAALPIPVTAFNLLPVLGVQRRVLSVYAPLFCFLVLAFIFYIRHTLALFMFPHHLYHRGVSMFKPKCFMLKLAPALFIFLALMSIIGYHAAIDRTIDQLLLEEAIDIKEWISSYGGESENGSERSRDDFMNILHQYFSGGFEEEEDIKNAQDYILMLIDNHVPNAVEGATLIGFYVSIFIFAEAAFILMALKEYMQDVIGISDKGMLGVEEKEHEPPEESKS